MNKSTLANALAYIAITDTTKFLHIETFVETQKFCDTSGRSPFYKLTNEGRALAESSALWKAHAHLIGLGFEVRTQYRQKPGHIHYQHPEPVETKAGRPTWRQATATRSGHVWAEVADDAAGSGWRIKKLARFKNG